MTRTATILSCAAIIAAMPVSGAFAAGRPDSRAMACDSARALVQDHQVVVMTTGPYSYARVVSGYGFCERGQYVDATFAPTLDNPSCQVGYICREKIVDNNF